MKEPISTELAPAAIGPYSQGIRTGSLLFISGQLPLDPATGKIVEGSMASQTERILQNIQAIVRESGGTLSDVVKTTIFLQDIEDFKEVNGAYGKVFGENPPARSTVQVAALPLSARIEIEAVAVLS